MLQEIIKRMQEIAKEVEEVGSKENLTPEDEKRVDELSVEFKELKDKKEKAEKTEAALKEARDFLNKPITQPIKPADDKGTPKGQFRNLGEFIQAVAMENKTHRADPRLTEVRELSVSGGDTPGGTKGGYLIPDEFLPTIKMVSLGEAVVRPRASIIPAGDIPDQGVEMPALDQTAVDGTGLYGGIEVDWITEGNEKTEADTGFKLIELDPKEVAAHIVVTDKLLRNTSALETLIASLFRGAISAAEEIEFLTGTHSSTRPTGIIGHAGTIAINRATSNRITYADIVNMFASSFGVGNYVWVASKSALPQLMQMKDFEASESDAPNLVFQPDARTGVLGTLLGLPLVYTDLLPALGGKGDLMLANFQYYLIKDGYGVEIAASEHVYFTTNRTVIKAFWNVDGKPWLTAPITLRDKVTKVSPFVILDVPSIGS
ncbi:MAG: phage major capsid protein [Methanofastidiosum sp.]|jgi:HK97 family phage major capsid protein